MTESSDALHERRGEAGVVGLETPPARAYWEVRRSDGSTRIYVEDTDVVAAVMAREITPDQESRHFGQEMANGTRVETKWKVVSKSLARSSFAVRQHFEPVWAHTMLGAGLGALAGMMFWFASGVYVFIFQSVNFPAGVIFGGFLIGWCFVAAETLWRAKQKTLFTRVAQVGAVLVVLYGFQAGIARAIAEVFMGMQAVFGASVAGALAGVFPGMLVGTLVGLRRRRAITIAPTAAPENMSGVIARGLIAPLAGLCGVAWSHGCT